MRVLVRCAVAVVISLGAGGPSPARGAGLEIPYRVRAISVDGELGDWAGQGLIAAFADSDPRGNRITAWLAWDHDALYAAFDVEDPSVFTAPDGIPGSQLYQWDSVELYVGPESDSDTMDSRDLQLIISPTGAMGTLRGDELLAMAGWRVPKREVKGVLAVAAATLTPTGYTVECAVPWPVLGLDPPTAGQVLRVNLANNNWLEDHPPLPEAVLDFDNLLLLHRGDPLDKPFLRLDDPEEIGWAAGRAILERAYLPVSWGGSRVFGEPATWRVATLAGGPPWAERVVAALGTRGVALTAALPVAAIAGLFLFALSRRERRRRGILLVRLHDLEEEAAALADGRAVATGIPAAIPVTASPTRARTAPSGGKVQYDPLTTTIDRVESLVRKGDPVPRSLCSQAIAFIVQHLRQPMTPHEVASGVHVSLRTLQRAVSTSLGCTPSELITAVRMREAQRLLAREGTLVKDVAFRLGFSSVSHFSRSFKNYFRVPPSELGSGQHPTLGSHN